jgi:hypothetical protein
MLELLQFAPGAPTARWVTLGLVIAAGIALIVAKRDVFHLAATGWLIAVVFLLIVWADRRGWVPFSIPNPEAMLAPAAIGMTLAVIVGVRSFEAELVSGEGRRQIRALSVLGGVAVTALFFTGLLSSLSGVWDAPTQSFSASTQFLVQQQLDEDADSGAGRVLWIGDASVLPLDVAVSETGIQYAVSDGGRAEARGRWMAGPVGATDGIGAQLDLARDGEVVRLGRLLAPYGISNVVVVSQLAPAPYVGPRVSPGVGIEQALSQQLDLELFPGVPNLVVYRNTSSGGIAPVLPSSQAALAASAAQQLDVDLANGSAPIINHRPGKWVLSMPADASVLLALDSNGLEATGARSEVAAGFDDLAVIPAGPAGEVYLEYSPRLRRQLALIGQFFLVAIGAILAQTRRETLG